MWKFSKLALFILFFTMTICAGISIAYINWDVIESGESVFQELQQPVLFVCLSLYFMFPYVKKLKEDSSSKKDLE